MFNYNFEQVKVSEDFIWYGKLFQILDKKNLKILFPKVTSLCTDIFKLDIYFFLISLLVSLKLKSSLINSGLRLLIVLKISIHTVLIYLHSLLLCLVSVTTLHMRSHKLFREILEVYFKGFQLSLEMRHSKASKLRDSNENLP